MRMGCLFNGVFWGVIIIIIGIVIIINVIFGTKIPIVPLFIGLLLIFLGIKIITNISWRKSPRAVIFEEKKIETKRTSGKYDVIFGRGEIDLTDIELKEEIVRIEINVVFSNAIVKINPIMPIKITASSAFASTRLPDGNMVAFGEYTYQTDSLKQTPTKSYLLIELHTVFGSTEVITK